MTDVREGDGGRARPAFEATRLRFGECRKLVTLVGALAAASAVTGCGGAARPRPQHAGVGGGPSTARGAKIAARSPKPGSVRVRVARAATAAPASSAPIAPVGNSAVTQYVESVPTAAGSVASTSIALDRKHDRVATPDIPSPSRRALVADGPDGNSAETLAAATAPAALLSGRGVDDPGERGQPSDPPGRSRPGSVPATVLQALTGSATPGTLGVLLPGILAAIVLVAGVETLLSRRRRKRVRGGVRNRYRPPRRRKD